MRIVSNRRAALASLVVLVVVLALGDARAQQAGAVVGQIVRLEGAAFVQREDMRTPLELGRAVRWMDRIHTAPDGRVVIEFRDGAVVTLGSGAELSVSDYPHDAADGFAARVLTLFRGIVRAVVPPHAAPPFALYGRTAVASVRGTELVVESSDKGTAIFVVDGTVRVAPTVGNGEIALAAGFGVDVPPGATAMEARRWGEPRVADVLARTRLSDSPAR